MESILLLHSKSIIKSSEQIDSHGDSVSSDSAREITDCLSFTCGAYELVALLLFDVDFRLIDDFVDEFSFNVGVSTIECNCALDAETKETNKEFYANCLDESLIN